MTRNFFVGGCLLGLVLVGGQLGDGLHNVYGHQRALRGTEQEALVANSLAGQLRASASSWLWLRTDRYLQGHLNASTEQSPEDAPEQQVGSVLERLQWTVDGRGERVARFNEPRDALPLFRLMTWIDPAFLPGWTYGARVIARDRRPESARIALSHLREGLRENPGSMALHSEMGYILATSLRDLDAAAREFAQAIRLSEPLQPDSLHPAEAKGLLDAYRFLALIQRRKGDIGRYYETLRAGRKRFPDDNFLNRALAEPTPPLKAAAAKWSEANRPSPRARKG